MTQGHVVACAQNGARTRSQLMCDDRGRVPCVWNDAIVCKPQAWPFLRSASVQVTDFPIRGQDQPRADVITVDVPAGRLVDLEKEGLLRGEAL